MYNFRSLLLFLVIMALAAMACSLPVPNLPGLKSTAVAAVPKPEIAASLPALKATVESSIQEKQTVRLPTVLPPTTAPGQPTKAASPVTPGGQPPASAKFPMPPGASLLTSTDTMAVIQVNMGLKECIAWYRDTLGKQGLKERTLLTASTNNSFNLVFDGAPNGMSLIVTGAVSGSNTTISLLYEKL